MVTALAGFWE